MSNNANNPTSFKNELEAAVKGLTTALPQGVTTIPIDRAAVPVADAVKTLGVYIAAYQTVDDDHVKLHADVLARNNIAPEAKAYLGQIRSAAVVLVGEQSVEFQQFGFVPRKASTPLTAEERAVKAARLRETRALRGTLGKQQKEPLKSTGPISVTIDSNGNASTTSVNANPAPTPLAPKDAPKAP